MGLKSFMQGGVVALAFTVLAAGAPARAQEIVTLDTIAGWDIIIDQTVDFGCAMQAEFEGGALVRMGFNPGDGNGYIMLFDQGWTDIREGQGYAIGMDVDGNSWTGDAEGIILAGLPGVYIPFDEPQFFIDIMKKYTLTLTHQGHEAIVVSLDGTYRALEGVMACQEGADSAR